MQAYCRCWQQEQRKRCQPCREAPSSCIWQGRPSSSGARLMLCMCAAKGCLQKRVHPFRPCAPASPVRLHATKLKSAEREADACHLTCCCDAAAVALLTTMHGLLGQLRQLATVFKLCWTGLRLVTLGQLHIPNAAPKPRANVVWICAMLTCRGVPACR